MRVCMFWVDIGTRTVSFSLSYPKRSGASPQLRRNKADLCSCQTLQCLYPLCSEVWNLFDAAIISTVCTKTNLSCMAALAQSFSVWVYIVNTTRTRTHTHTHKQHHCVWVGSVSSTGVCKTCHEPGSRWRFIDFNRITLLSNNSTAWGKEGP